MFQEHFQKLRIENSMGTSEATSKQVKRKVLFIQRIAQFFSILALWPNRKLEDYTIAVNAFGIADRIST